MAYDGHTRRENIVTIKAAVHTKASDSAIGIMERPNPPSDHDGRARARSANDTPLADEAAPFPAAAGATRAYADFVVRTTLDDLPDGMVVRLRSLLLDMVGITAFAAGHVESSPSINAAIVQLDPDEGPATAIGMSRGFSWPYAALLNGAHAHSLDFDDTNAVQNGHPGAPVISAVLSDAERLGSDGRAFFEAMAVGYEIACRAGGAIGEGAWARGFHMTSVSGIFGAVAAIGKLRGFNAATLENAFGLALSKAAGSMQYLDNGAWNKRLHPGFAAHDALVCAALAEAGVIGASKSLEGKYGLMASYTGEPHPEILLDGLGKNWVAMQTAVKPYPSCRLTHGAVDATLKLREQVPPAERDGATFAVELSAAGMRIVGGATPDKVQPGNPVSAQFSVYFQVAAAWQEGQVEWSVYDRLRTPDLQAAAKRVTATVNTSLPNNAANVTVSVSGKTLRESVLVPLGEPNNWIGDDELRRKFMLLAVPVYGQDHAARIADAVLSFKPEDSVRSIVKLLRVLPAPADNPQGAYQ